RTARPTRDIADELRRRDDDGHAGAVVDSARALVPAVHVRAEEDDLLRPLAAAYVGDDILRTSILDVRGAREEPHAHRLSERRQALDLVGVGVAERKREIGRAHV